MDIRNGQQLSAASGAFTVDRGAGSAGCVLAGTRRPTRSTPLHKNAGVTGPVAVRVIDNENGPAR